MRVEDIRPACRCCRLVGRGSAERAARAMAADVRTSMAEPGLPCRAWLCGCIAPSAEHTRIWETFPRRSSTTRSTWQLQRTWATGRGRAGRTRTSASRIGISKRTSHGVCNGDVTRAPVGKRGGGHADAHVQRLLSSEVLQCRSPKDGFEKSRIGRESDDRAAQGYLPSA